MKFITRIQSIITCLLYTSTVNRSKLKEQNIYSGLGGGFGGASYQYTTLCESAEDSEKEAYESAVEEYQSYEGFNSIPIWSDSLDAAMEENPGVSFPTPVLPLSTPL